MVPHNSINASDINTRVWIWSSDPLQKILLHSLVHRTLSATVNCIPVSKTPGRLKGITPRGGITEGRRIFMFKYQRLAGAKTFVMVSFCVQWKYSVRSLCPIGCLHILLVRGYESNSIRSTSNQYNNSRLQREVIKRPWLPGVKLYDCVDDWPISAGHEYFCKCMGRPALDELWNSNRYIQQAEPGDVISVTLMGSTTISSKLTADWFIIVCIYFPSKQRI